MPDISTLIKKSDYDTKIAEIENKYVSNTGFGSNLAQANVITKRHFDAKIIELDYNYLIRAILKVKVILKKIVYKII